MAGKYWGDVLKTRYYENSQDFDKQLLEILNILLTLMIKVKWKIFY